MAEEKKRNLYVEFQQQSQDFLMILGQKSRAAGRSKDAANELATLEFFWDAVDNIFKQYEQQLQELRMLATNEHCKAIILRNELRETYNEVYKVRAKIPDTVLKLMQKTTLPSKEDFQEDVQLKNRPANG